MTEASGIFYFPSLVNLNLNFMVTVFAYNIGPVNLSLSEELSLKITTHLKSVVNQY